MIHEGNPNRTHGGKSSDARFLTPFGRRGRRSTPFTRKPAITMMEPTNDPAVALNPMFLDLTAMMFSVVFLCLWAMIGEFAIVHP